MDIEATKAAKNDLIRVFVRGGILSPGDLLRIMEISETLGNDFVMFGSRQDILFPLNGRSSAEAADLFRDTGIDYEWGFREAFQNIASSYVAVNITASTQWVKEDTYHYVIENFDYLPRLKINIVDPLQSMVPLFTGHLNFIASRQENYWYLCIRNHHSGNIPETWPKLIFSQDIAKVAKFIEKKLLQTPELTIDDLFLEVQNTMRVNSLKPEEKLKLPPNLFPYYEGLNALSNNLLWLGLYWRNNKFDIDFLRAACRLCQETNIGTISITPWKSFIIKGIKPSDQLRWEKLMGKFGINMRHSSLELNWHLPVLDQEALDLKRFLVRELDQQDISTHGLTFTIKTEGELLLFTSIVIEKDQEVVAGPDSHYTIRYAKDFNPHLPEYYTYARGVVKEVLPALLIELSKIYFRQLNPEKDLPAGQSDSREEPPADPADLCYQCSNCLTIYDKKIGDPAAGIAAGMPFEKLPDHYRCHVCDSGKEHFKPVRSF
ncbi:nitrite/sulfite reductase ferredoxin-like protein [Anseongella ginsenosidimutans]|uniref:Nitrite/sulfite reductase ferredoxin-like protein n=1 Tax=Anseongella ginsenosidimutans TaxID=496056 RepID=A0A4V2UUC4_9SPHI|nr:rubredoxin [Anseongella ginsenosidimutans]QEC51175.1 rubredoxin domain-containing protein [Anseongella ginsenosidimutans]TCS90153.1 nitrite/sulfite reductase ferredoxin-like protein [Anseongella ginsenosidimutans]